MVLCEVYELSTFGAKHNRPVLGVVLREPKAGHVFANPMARSSKKHPSIYIPKAMMNSHPRYSSNFGIFLAWSLGAPQSKPKTIAAEPGPYPQAPR